MDDQTLHQQFSDYGRQAREWMRQCVLLLPEIERRKIWKKRGFSSLFEYAAKLAGMSRSAVEDALQVMRKVEALPVLRAVVEQRGIYRVRPVLSVATPETQTFWADKARHMSRHTLETYVKNYRLERRTGPATEPEKVAVSLKLSEALARRLEQFKKRADFELLLERFLNNTEAPPSVRTDSRHIPLVIRRFVEQRTGGCCAYPSCMRPAISLHHTQRWGLERVHDPARLHALCTAHERLAHLGLIENEEGPPETWLLRDYADPLLPKRFVDELVARYRPT